MFKRIVWVMIVFALTAVIQADKARAYNLSQKYIHYIGFFDDGRIWFTLYNEGSQGPAFRCSESRQPNRLWIEACGSDDLACLIRNDRLGTMLLSAKLAGKPIYVEVDRQPNQCTVSEVAFQK